MRNRNFSARFRALRREIGVKLHNEGALGTLKLGSRRVWRYLYARAALKRVSNDDFDRIHGTDTAERVPVGALDIPDELLTHAVGYSTAIQSVFLEAVGALPIRYEDFSFVDLGSGKGRAVLLASRFPFRRIIGVEMSRMLHNTALKNVSIYNSRRQEPVAIECICMNAGLFHMPDGNLVIYLFNPFGAKLIESVIENMRNAFLRVPRKIFVVYLKAVHRTIFDTTDIFEVWQGHGRWVTYQTH